VFHLLLRPLHQTAVILRSIAPQHTFLHALAEKTVHGISVWHWVTGKLVSEIMELKAQTRGEYESVFDGSGYVAEERCHLTGCAEVALTVRSQKAACLIEFDMIANGREKIEYLALIRCGVPDPIGGDDRQIEGSRDAEGSLVAPLFLAVLVALQFDVYTSTTEDAGEFFYCLPARGFASA